MRQAVATTHSEICAVARAYGALVAAHGAASEAARGNASSREAFLAAHQRLEDCHRAFEAACAAANIDPTYYITARRTT